MRNMMRILLNKTCYRPREHVPLGRPSTRFSAKGIFGFSRNAPVLFVISESDHLFGGLSWASSLLFSPLRPA
jgi:hypothetical protein